MKPEDVKPGVKVRHYKGHEYTVIALAHLESAYSETFPELSRCVVYGDGTRNWIRLMDHGANAFCGEASHGVERFTLILEGK